MKKISFLTILIFLLSFTSFSQTKKLTIEEAVAGQWRELFPEQLSGVQPFGENNFTYVKDYKQIFQINQATGEDKEIANSDQINEALVLISAEKIPYFPYWDYSWKSESVMEFTFKNVKYEFDNNTKKIITKNDLPENAENIKASDANSFIAYTIDNNLYFNDNKGKSVQITFDENPGIVNGNGYTHRQEFGITEGSFWSPSGYFIAFYKKDETMVTDYPLVDVSTRIATLKNSKYPMIGEKSEEVKLGVYNLKTAQTTFMDVTDFTAERYLTSITWSPDEMSVYIGVLNREQNHLIMNEYNAQSGKYVKTLYEEKNPRYVEPEHQLYFVKNQTDKFITFSERDGYDHLYLYNTEGELISQLTKGNWVVTSFLGFDQKGENIFFEGTKDSPIETHTYILNLKSKVITNLTIEKGTHKTVISKSGKFIFDSYSSNEIPNNNKIVDSKGTTIKTLLSAKNPLADYKLGKSTTGTIKAADGKTDLYYRMITPPDFDPNKKYPVIVYVYGGPHAQLVNNEWVNGGLWNYYMAQKAYVVFTVDGRGSANRGFDFESIIHRQCGVEESKDQMKGVEFLKSLPYIDKNRIGVHGWSYGGFMTTTLMTDYADVFKVGVAGGPVIDWKYYEVMYGERYMDTPEENAEGFENTSLLSKAEKLQGRLLMIHGYIDPVVVPQNSLDFIRSCIKSNTDIDYFLYPESEHNMAGKTRIHLMKKVTRYFDDYLCPECKK